MLRDLLIERGFGEKGGFLSFAMLVWIWFEQHKYFRRYGLSTSIR